MKHSLSAMLRAHMDRYRGAWKSKLTDELKAALEAIGETDVNRAAATIFHGPSACKEGNTRPMQRVKDGWMFCSSSKSCPCYMAHFREASVATNMAKYGVPNAAQVEAHKAKSRDTCMTKYGVPTTGASLERRAKAAATCLENYGHANPFGSQMIQQQMREKNQALHGVDYLMELPEHQTVMREGVRAKYGVDNVLQLDYFREQIAAKNMEKFGGPAPACDPQIIAKMKATSLARFNALGCNKHITPEHHIHGREDFARRFTGRKAKDIAKETGYHISMIHRYARLWDVELDYSGGSCRELENVFGQCLRDEFGDIFEQNQKILGEHADKRHNKEIDFYCKEKQLGIEFCGVWYHSEAKGRFKDYHANKLNLADKQGIRLLQIFEDEWELHPEAVLSAIRHLLGLTIQKCFARHTTISIVSHAEAQSFYATYHVYGGVSASVHYGLIHDETLVACMSFTNRHETAWELVRYATSQNVVGGASKLLKAFERHHVDITRLVSFVDLRWSRGGLYEILGFTREATLPPDFAYVIGNRRVHKFNLRKTSKRFQKYEPQMTGEQMADAEGITRTWDAGKLRYVKTYKTRN